MWPPSVGLCSLLPCLPASSHLSVLTRGLLLLLLGAVHASGCSVEGRQLACSTAPLLLLLLVLWHRPPSPTRLHLLRTRMGAGAGSASELWLAPAAQGLLGARRQLGLRGSVGCAAVGAWRVQRIVGWRCDGGTIVPRSCGCCLQQVARAVLWLIAASHCTGPVSRALFRLVVQGAEAAPWSSVPAGKLACGALGSSPHIKSSSAVAGRGQRTSWLGPAGHHALAGPLQALHLAAQHLQVVRLQQQQALPDLHIVQRDLRTCALLVPARSARAWRCRLGPYLEAGWTEQLQCGDHFRLHRAHGLHACRQRTPRRQTGAGLHAAVGEAHRP